MLYRPVSSSAACWSTGVEGEEQNITPTVAYYIGVGFASWLSETLQVPPNSLQISVTSIASDFCSYSHLFVTHRVKYCIQNKPQMGLSHLLMQNGFVQIGRDSRLSGPLLLASMVAGLASQGVSVAQFGMATTPAMFMSCIIPGMTASPRHYR